MTALGQQTISVNKLDDIILDGTIKKFCAHKVNNGSAKGRKYIRKDVQSKQKDSKGAQSRETRKKTGDKESLRRD